MPQRKPKSWRIVFANAQTNIFKFSDASRLVAEEEERDPDPNSGPDPDPNPGLDLFSWFLGSKFAAQSK